MMISLDTIQKYEHDNSQHVRNRARIVLLTLEGQTTAYIASEVGLE